MTRTRTARSLSLARQADRYDLYQRSVQEPEAEVRFFQRVYRQIYGRNPLVLREDFCGTAAICCQWVRGSPRRQALGVDLDPIPLAWARQHNLPLLPLHAQARVQLVQDDVRTVHTPKAQVISAQNFSFCVFHRREELRRYFQSARQNLGRQGVLVLDLMGGWQVFQDERQDVRRLRGFKYIWDQSRFDPITHSGDFHIHFRFPDGSELKRAFTYHWRLWSIVELRELLKEAGFRRSYVYWEGTHRLLNRGNGVYARREHAPNDPAWIAYVVGVK